MDVFIWNMAISFQLLFIVISGVIFIYIGEKSFKYYVLYNICLVLYLLSRNDSNYYNFQHIISDFIGTANAEVFMHLLNFFIQVVFYAFYSIFALYFLDLDKKVKKFFFTVIWILRALIAVFFLFAVVCFILKNPNLYIGLYSFIFLPVMLGVFFISVVRALKHSGKHKEYFLFGVCTYVFCALVAFFGTFIPSLHIKNPISFFYVGIVFETIFFSLGLAFKIKLINDEKNRVSNLVLKHKHQQQISKLKGLLEGEEKERNRIAAELHDGIAGDLFALKFNVANLNRAEYGAQYEEILTEISQIIDKSCVQIREISHNLSPSTITNFGLLQAVHDYCKKAAKIYNIKIDFAFSGEKIDLGTANETHIYRIIQELINNIVKHSEASSAQVFIENYSSKMTISVKDNGKGFSPKTFSNGIGLNNIESRITFLEAVMNKVSDHRGTSYTIDIDADKIRKA